MLHIKITYYLLSIIINNNNNINGTTTNHQYPLPQQRLYCKPTTTITHQYQINPNFSKKKKPTTRERQSERRTERRGKRVRSTAASGEITYQAPPSTAKSTNHWPLLKPIYHHRWTQERGNLSRSPPWQTQQIKLISHHHHTTVNPQPNFNLKREIRNQKCLNPIR